MIRGAVQGSCAEFCVRWAAADVARVAAEENAAQDAKAAADAAAADAATQERVEATRAQESGEVRIAAVCDCTTDAAYGYTCACGDPRGLPEGAPTAR
jgi:hypothetical protein